MTAWLLRLVVGQAASNPLVLIWVAAGIAVAAGTAGFGAGWKVNGWRLGEDLAQCETRASQFEQAYLVLAGKVGEQNDSILDLKKKGDAARQAGRQASAVAKMEADQREGEIAALRTVLAAQTPAGKTCATAWADIRAGKLP